ncbi:hypothetical protein [Lacrimispora sp. JR3]|uniref:hypothetical protein n=1 Tax=Lacrimispora sinapis TaxID=3111456 RepID=UPI00374A0265
MKHLLEKWKNGMKEESKKYLKFLAIPLIVIILMSVVIVLDKSGKDHRSGTVGGSAAGTEENASAEAAAAKITLMKESVPEIHDLMEAYFKARKTCDSEALSEVYGGTCSAEELSQQSARLEEEVKFYQDYENLVCYTAPGLLEGDFLVYAKFDIKFRQAETLAPSLIVCYAKKGTDHTYYLVANPDKNQSALMDKANRSDEVQKLAKEVNEGLDQALKSDENLLAVYHTLMDQKEDSQESAASSGADESSAEETEAATESGSQTNNM